MGIHDLRNKTVLSHFLKLFPKTAPTYSSKFTTLPLQLQHQHLEQANKRTWQN